MDAKSLARGQHVSLLRRFVAFVIDNAVVMGIISGLLSLLARLLGVEKLLPGLLLQLVLPVFFVHVLVPTFNRGATWGKALVKLQVVDAEGRPAGFWRLLLRALLLYGLALQSGRGFMLMFTEIFSKFHRSELNFILLGLFGLIMAFLVVNFLWEFVTRDNRYFYDVWAHTHQVSTVKQVDNQK